MLMLCQDGDWECECPIDFTGGKCGHHRDYSCEITLLSPEPRCIPFADPSLRKLDSDPVCLEFSVNDMVTFSYSIECSFTELEGLVCLPSLPTHPLPHHPLCVGLTSPSSFLSSLPPPPSPPLPSLPLTPDLYQNETEAYAFEYYARRGTEFAKSAVEVPFQASLRVFDFARLSDMSKSQVLDLSPDQLAHGEPFVFDLDINHIYASSTYKPRFFFGGRMYIEAGTPHL